MVHKSKDRITHQLNLIDLSVRIVELAIEFSLQLGSNLRPPLDPIHLLRGDIVHFGCIDWNAHFDTIDVLDQITTTENDLNQGLVRNRETRWHCVSNKGERSRGEGCVKATFQGGRTGTFGGVVV